MRGPQVSRIFESRLDAVEFIGGVSTIEVVDLNAGVPSGWKLDPLTEYYIPPGVALVMVDGGFRLVEGIF